MRSSRVDTDAHGLLMTDELPCMLTTGTIVKSVASYRCTIDGFVILCSAVTCCDVACTSAISLSYLHGRERGLQLMLE